VLVPDKVQVPVPFLFNDVVVEITPDIVPVPSPPKVNPKAPVTFPLQVNVPEAVAVMVLADAKVMAPLKIAAPPVLVKAPPLDMPEPFKVKASGIEVLLIENPFKSKTAPEATVVPAAFDPNGPLSAVLKSPPIPNFKVPSLIVVAPL
jgi:hypothetical protein